MKYLLDTSVVSELRKGDRADPALLEWLDFAADDEIHLSVLVVGDVRRAAESIRKRDGARARALERWLTQVVTAHADRIVAIGPRVAEEWGRLAAMRPAPAFEALMAATALVHGLVLVTRNAKELAWTGASCLDPFTPSARRR